MESQESQMIFIKPENACERTGPSHHSQKALCFCARHTGILLVILNWRYLNNLAFQSFASSSLLWYIEIHLHLHVVHYCFYVKIKTVESCHNKLNQTQDCKHNSNWEYVNKSIFVLTSLWKELGVNLFEGFFINNTTGAFLEKMVEKQYEQSVHKTEFFCTFCNRTVNCAELHQEN